MGIDLRDFPKHKGLMLNETQEVERFGSETREMVEVSSAFKEIHDCIY